MKHLECSTSNEKLLGKCDPKSREKSGNINRPRKKIDDQMNKQTGILKSYYKYVEGFRGKHNEHMFQRKT